MDSDNTVAHRNDQLRDVDQEKRCKSRQPKHIAYQVRDRGPNNKAAFDRIGETWEHDDGKGFDLALKSVPVDGRVCLRELRKQEFKVQRREGQSQSRSEDRKPDQSRDR